MSVKQDIIVSALFTLVCASQIFLCSFYALFSTNCSQFPAFCQLALRRSIARVEVVVFGGSSSMASVCTLFGYSLNLSLISILMIYFIVYSGSGAFHDVLVEFSDFLHLTVSFFNYEMRPALHV